LYLYLRGENKKGVKILSMEDGTLITEIKMLHTNPICQILLSHDNYSIVTAGMDKKVKVWSNVNYEL